jgi:hypothetical protein
MRSATKLPAKTGRPADPPETRQRVGGSSVRKVKVAGGIDPPPSVMSKAAGLPAAGLPGVKAPRDPRPALKPAKSAEARQSPPGKLTNRTAAGESSIGRFYVQK